jgi:ketol-acid reductoisomerase
MAQPAVFNESVAPNLKTGALLLFAHGFNIHYGLLTPGTHVDVALVAPKAPGQRVRHEYCCGRGVPALLAVHQDATGHAQERALAYAHGIGSTRAGVLETSFSEETETDLFGEQAVLCGGVTELVVAGFETLVEAGYNPEVAYFECLHELKLIVDLLHEGGLARMHRFVSDTASFGDVTRGPKVVDSHVRNRLKSILTEIQSGAFAREWCTEYDKGSTQFKDLVEADLAHPIEAVGQRLRERMPWLKEAS